MPVPPPILLAVLLTTGNARAAGTVWPSIDEPVKGVAAHQKDGAVVIGVEDYFRLPDVPFAQRDANAFADWAKYTRGIPVDRVLSPPSNPIASEILAAAYRAGDMVGRDGTVFIYFSGHGILDRSGGRLLLGGNAAGENRADLEGGGVTLDAVEAAAGVGGARVVVIADVCSVPVGDHDAVPAYALRRLRVVEWLATGEGETSGPLDGAQHAAFTYFVLRGLRGEADGQLAAADGTVRGDEATEYVLHGLRGAGLTAQNPIIQGDGWADFDFGTLSVPPRPKLDPEAARRARLDAARANLLLAASNEWNRTVPTLREYNAESVLVVQSFLDTYTNATVGEGSVTERVVVPEVDEAQEARDALARAESRRTEATARWAEIEKVGARNRDVREFRRMYQSASVTWDDRTIGISIPEVADAEAELGGHPRWAWTIAGGAGLGTGGGFVIAAALAEAEVKSKVASGGQPDIEGYQSDVNLRSAIGAACLAGGAGSLLIGVAPMLTVSADGAGLRVGVRW